MTLDARPGVARYAHPLRPTRTSTLSARNAVTYAACSLSNFHHADGSVTERELGRREIIGQSGAGMIAHQGAWPDAEGRGGAEAVQED